MPSPARIATTSGGRSPRGPAARLATSTLAAVLITACAPGLALAGQAYFPDGPPLQVNLSAPDHMGTSVALSSDSSTALAGTSASHLGSPLAWPFLRIPAGWAQQGTGLAAGWGSRSEGGWPVALSDDGNTAIVEGIGPPGNFASQVTIAVRHDGAWSTQQVLPTVGTTTAIAIAGDGATAVTASYNGLTVWKRGVSTWTQEAALSPGDGFGETGFGAAVDISTDGNTVVAGGNLDNVLQGAAWTFRRTAGSWAQSGPKLAVAGANQMGSTVALSGDAAVLLVGSRQNWPVHAFSADGTGWTPAGQLGTAVNVALSADGATALVGGRRFHRSAGAWSSLTSGTGVGTGPVALSGDGTRAVVGTPAASDSAGQNGVGAMQPFSLQPSASLNVQLAGAGGGTVDGAGVHCVASDAAVCAIDLPRGTPATLTATAATGSRFSGWAGACTGLGDCRVPLDNDAQVTATFAPGTQTPATSDVPKSTRPAAATLSAPARTTRKALRSGLRLRLNHLTPGSSVTARLLAASRGLSRASSRADQRGRATVQLRLTNTRRLGPRIHRLTVRCQLTGADGKHHQLSTTITLH